MQAAAPDIATRFAIMIAGLCRVVAAHIAADSNASAWIILVWNRLSRLSRRVERLAAQVRAGTVPKLGARFTLTRPRKPAKRPPIVLAGKAGWLIHAVLPAAAWGSYLQQLLDGPEMAALLTAAPQKVFCFFFSKKKRLLPSYPRGCVRRHTASICAVSTAV